MTHPKTIKDIQRMNVKELAEFLKAEGFEKCQEVFITKNISGAQFLSYEEVHFLFLETEIRQELKRLWKFRVALETTAQGFQDKNKLINHSFKHARSLFENDSKLIGESSGPKLKKSHSIPSSLNSIVNIKKKVPAVIPVATEEKDEDTEESNRGFSEARKRIFEPLQRESQLLKTTFKDSINNIHQNSAAIKTHDEIPNQVFRVISSKDKILPPTQKNDLLSEQNEIQEVDNVEKESLMQHHEFPQVIKPALPPKPRKTFPSTSEDELKQEGYEVHESPKIEDEKGLQQHEVAPVLPSRKSIKNSSSSEIGLKQEAYEIHESPKIEDEKALQQHEVPPVIPSRTSENEPKGYAQQDSLEIEQIADEKLLQQHNVASALPPKPTKNFLSTSRNNLKQEGHRIHELSDTESIDNKKKSQHYEVAPVFLSKPIEKLSSIFKNDLKPEVKETQELSKIDVVDELRQQFEVAPVIPPKPSHKPLTASKSAGLFPSNSKVHTMKGNETKKGQEEVKSSFLENRRKISVHLEDRVSYLKEVEKPITNLENSIIPPSDKTEMEEWNRVDVVDNTSFIENRTKVSAHLEDRVSYLKEVEKPITNFKKSIITPSDTTEMEEWNDVVDDTNISPPKRNISVQHNTDDMEEIEDTDPNCSTTKDKSFDVNIINDPSVNKENLEQKALRFSKMSAAKSTEQEEYDTLEPKKIDNLQETDCRMFEGGYARPPPVLKPRKDPVIPTREDQVLIEPEPDISSLSPEYLEKINEEKNELFEPNTLSNSSVTEINKISQKYEQIVGHGAFIDASKQKAKNMLTKSPAGSYLLHRSTEKTYALMVKTNKNIYSIPIVVVAECFQIQFEIDMKKDPLISFVFFEKLIEHYKKNPIIMGGEKIYLRKKNNRIHL